MDDKRIISAYLHPSRRSAIAVADELTQAEARYPRWTLLLWGAGAWAVVLLPLWFLLRTL